MRPVKDPYLTKQEDTDSGSLPFGDLRTERDQQGLDIGPSN
jgi:hypothetical protein